MVFWDHFGCFFQNHQGMKAYHQNDGSLTSHLQGCKCFWHFKAIYILGWIMWAGSSKDISFLSNIFFGPQSMQGASICLILLRGRKRRNIRARPQFFSSESFAFGMSSSILDSLGIFWIFGCYFGIFWNPLELFEFFCMLLESFEIF